MIGASLEGVTAVNVTATKTKFQKANLKNAGKLLLSSEIWIRLHRPSKQLLSWWLIGSDENTLKRKKN